jgi:hypothetical protein
MNKVSSDATVVETSLLQACWDAEMKCGHMCVPTAKLSYTVCRLRSPNPALWVPCCSSSFVRSMRALCKLDSWRENKGPWTKELLSLFLFAGLTCKRNLYEPVEKGYCTNNIDMKNDSPFLQSPSCPSLELCHKIFVLFSCISHWRALCYIDDLLIILTSSSKPQTGLQEYKLTSWTAVLVSFKHWLSAYIDL